MLKAALLSKDDFVNDSEKFDATEKDTKIMFTQYKDAEKRKVRNAQRKI
jgi:hypothetical protein